jgi:twinkle protein
VRFTPLELVRKHFGEYRTKGREIRLVECPYCHGGRHHDKYTFSINAETGAFNCKRGSCGVTGTFYRLLIDFREIDIMDTREYHQRQEKKRFKKSTAKIEAVSNKVMEYLKLRGISKETCDAYGVGDDGRGNIAFPYIKNNVQVAVKFRAARKLKPGEQKMWREEGTDTTTLFGMQTVIGDSLVITEGENDALALYEAGIKNVVSIPNGSEDFGWVKANWAWLEGFKSIVLCGDNDEPGRDMIRSLVPKLGEWRVRVTELPEDCKDANEALIKHGKQKLNDTIINAKEVPIEALVRMAEVKALDLDKITKVASGIRGLDRKIGGFMMGQVSVWTGINGGGKSTLLGQLMIESVEQGYSVCAFSGELPNPLFRYWIELQMGGPCNLSHKYDYMLEGDRPYIDNQTAVKIRTWYYDYFFLYDSLSVIDIESVMRVFTNAARKHDCKVFLVDNLMMMIGGTGDDYYRRQSEFMKQVSAFAKKFDVHVHIVAHPRKTNGRVTKMDVGGTGDITNLADNVFGVHRISNDEREDKEMVAYEECDTLLEVFKSRFTGRQEIIIGLKFHDDCKRFYMAKDNSLLRKKYGWEAQINETERGDAWEGEDNGQQCPF